MVEVFKTDIRKRGELKTLISKLLVYYPGCYINIDFDDCDNVLRVEGQSICPNIIIDLVTADGYRCEMLV